MAERIDDIIGLIEERRYLAAKAKLYELKAELKDEQGDREGIDPSGSNDDRDRSNDPDFLWSAE